jgi:hypothetical protein
MHRRALSVSSWCCAAFLVSCGERVAPEETDASIDAGLDASEDVGMDATRDVGFDVGRDAPRFDVAGDAPLPACSNASPLALTQCVEETRYQTDLVDIAMERVPASAQWQRVQDLCATRLASLGFEVERQAYGTGVNVIGVRMGTTDPEHRVVLGAHYDHIAGCAGADDNATGVAGLLEAARVLSTASYPRTLVVACWDEEEAGLLGSLAYAGRARTRREQIDMNFTFEMIGYTSHAPGSQSIPTGFDLLFPEGAAEVAANESRGDFVAVVGDPASNPSVAMLEHYADWMRLPFVPLVVPMSLLSSPLIGDLRRSDHASFWATRVPAVMITDTSNFRYANYHCFEGEDVVANLDQHFASQIVAMTVGAAAETLGL